MKECECSAGERKTIKNFVSLSSHRQNAADRRNTSRWQKSRNYSFVGFFDILFRVFFSLPSSIGNWKNFTFSSGSPFFRQPSAVDRWPLFSPQLHVSSLDGFLNLPFPNYILFPFSGYQNVTWKVRLGALCAGRSSRKRRKKKSSDCIAYARFFYLLQFSNAISSPSVSFG